MYLLTLVIQFKMYISIPSLCHYFPRICIKTLNFYAQLSIQTLFMGIQNVCTSIQNIFRSIQQ